MNTMVFVGVGGNLPSPHYGPPVATCSAAVDALAASGIAVVRRSRWYRSLPVPNSGQPHYVNGVIRVETTKSPAELLCLLHAIEAEFGRERGERNAARVLDLDLLCYDDWVSPSASGVELPHPRMHERAFVLKPLAELAPDWRHPVLGGSVVQLLEMLPPGQSAEPIET
jgi:2-amino-4-hydroxy-6-hydroxymethyldihydropteridine diphosphokinase